MREEHKDAERAFYEAVAATLGASHEYQPWTGRGPNRWNNRRPGNGRFAGFGTVRYFSPTVIHVCLHAPRALNRVASSTDEALALLRESVTQALRPGSA